MAADFDPTDAKALVLHWKPETPGEKLFIIEVDSFGRETLRDYEYLLPGVAEGPNDVGTPYPILPVPGPFPIRKPVSP